MTDRGRKSSVRVHVILLGVFLVLLAHFAVLAVLTTILVEWSPVKWAIPVLLMLTTGAFVAWEVFVLLRLRGRR